MAKDAEEEQVEKTRISDRKDFEFRFTNTPFLENNEYEGYNFIVDVPIIIQQPTSLTFVGCVFERSIVIVESVSSQVDFISCQFLDEVDFGSVEFKGKVSIHSCQFKGIVSFNNTSFSDLCDFWDTTFHQITIFYKTDFYKTVVFSRCIFLENVLFTYTLIEKYCILRAADFRKGIDFSNALISGNLNLFDIRITDYDCILKVEDHNDYEDQISSIGNIPEKNKRETFRILRKQLESQSDYIRALWFAAQEMKSYRCSRFLNFSTLSLRSKIRVLRDWSTLKLNALSNSYGQSWIAGVVFTLTVSVIFYYLSIISTEDYSIGFDFSSKNVSINAKYFFEFMTPTHKVDFLDAAGATGFTYLWDFIGRIFVAYGIYQTVQAFRKYKN